MHGSRLAILALWSIACGDNIRVAPDASPMPDTMTIDGITGCTAPADCPGADTECRQRTCTNGTCGVVDMPANTPISTQSDGDCKLVVCDGAGETMPVTDTTDIGDDNNECTTDTCSDTGPVFTPVAPGTACGNGLTCNLMGQCAGCNTPDDCGTQTDLCNPLTCNANVCGTAPVTCTASDQCHVAGTCNPSTGTCSNPAANDGTTCNDGNNCTVADTCQSGTCTSGPPRTCTASDQCHVAGTCNPATGNCSNPNAPNGTTCDDSNPCTTNDACRAGACSQSTPTTCMALDECHVAGTCDPASGSCSNPNAPNGTLCTGGACQNGTCQPIVAACGNGMREGTEQCDDGNTIDCDGCSPMCRTQTTHEITGRNVAIQDGTFPLLFCISVPVPAGAGDGDNVVDSVCVSRVGVTHDWIGDLVMLVESPAATQVTLMDRPGTTGAPLDFGDDSDLSETARIRFIDGAPDDPETMGDTIEDGTPQGDQVVCRDDMRCTYAPGDGTAAPLPLSTFRNESSTGNWRLCVGDAALSSAGFINSFGLTIE